MERSSAEGRGLPEDADTGVVYDLLAAAVEDMGDSEVFDLVAEVRRACRSPSQPCGCRKLGRGR